MEPREPIKFEWPKAGFDWLLKQKAAEGWTAYEGTAGLFETKFNTDGTGRFLDVQVRTKDDLIATYGKGGTVEVELVPYVFDGDFAKMAEEEGLKVPDHKISYQVFTRPKKL